MFYSRIAILFCVLTLAACEKTPEAPAPQPQPTEAAQGDAVAPPTAPAQAADTSSAAAPTPADTAGAAAAAATDTQPPPAAQAESASLLTTWDGLAHVPSEVIGIAVTPNLVASLNTLGRETLMKRFTSEYEEMVQEVVQEVGRNLLDPAELTRMGIAVDQPVGAFLMHPETGGVVFSLTDREVFKNALYEMAPRLDTKLQIEAFGDALYLFPRDNPKLGFILLENHAIAFVDDRNKALAIDTAASIAKLTPEKSLASHPQLGSLSSKLSGDAMIELYADLDGLLLSEHKNNVDSLRKYLEWERDTAKERGGDPEETQRAQQRIERMERDLKRAEGEYDTLRAHLSRAMGLDAGLIASGRIEGNRVQLELHTEHGGELGKLMTTFSGKAPVISLLEKAPAFLLHAKVDPRFLIELLLSFEGDTLDDLAKAMADPRVGLSLEQDILAHLNGESAWVLDLPQADPDGFTLGGTLWLGLNDVEKARPSVERILKLRDFEKVKEVGPGTWSAELDGMQIHVGLTSNALLVTTNTRLFEAGMGGGGFPVDFTSRLQPAQLAEHLNAPDQTAVAFISTSSLMQLFLLNSGMSSAPSAAFGGPGPDSPEYLAKIKELEALDATIAEHHAAFREAENTRAEKLLDGFGDIAARCKGSASHLGCDAMLHIQADSAAQLTLSWTETIIELNKLKYDYWDREHKLDQQRRELINAIDAMRQAAPIAPAPTRIKTAPVHTATGDGQLRPSDIKATLGAHMKTFKKCKSDFASASGVAPARRGGMGKGAIPKPTKITVELTIEQDGSVSQAAAQGTQTRVSGCVVKAVKTVTFPSHTQPPLKTQYTFEL